MVFINKVVLILLRQNENKYFHIGTVTLFLKGFLKKLTEKNYVF